MPDMKRKNIISGPLVNTFLRLGPKAVIPAQHIQISCGITRRS
jgi:hypothetical protein